MTVTRADFKGMTDEQVCKLALYRLQNLNVKFESFATECELFGGIENEEDPSKSIPPNPYKDNTAIEIAVLIYNGLAVEPVNWDDIAQLKTALVIKTAKPKESITTPPSFNSDEDIKTATSEMGGISSHTDIDSEEKLQKKLAVIAKYETLLVKSEKEIMESTLNRMLIVSKAITKIGSSEHPELADYKEKFIQLQGYYQEILDSYNKVGKKVGIGWDPSLTKGLSSDTVLGYIQNNTKFSSGMANWGVKYVSDLVYKGNDVFPGVLKSDNPDKAPLDKAYSEVGRMRNLFGPINSDLLKDFMTQMYDAKIQGYGTVLSDNLVSYTGTVEESTEEDSNQYNASLSETNPYDKLCLADLGPEVWNKMVDTIIRYDEYQRIIVNFSRSVKQGGYPFVSRFLYHVGINQFRFIERVEYYKAIDLSNEYIISSMTSDSLELHFLDRLSNHILDIQHSSFKWDIIDVILSNMNNTIGLNLELITEFKSSLLPPYPETPRFLMQHLRVFLESKGVNNYFVTLVGKSPPYSGDYLLRQIGYRNDSNNHKVVFKDYLKRLDFLAEYCVRSRTLNFQEPLYGKLEFPDFNTKILFISKEIQLALDSIHSDETTTEERLLSARIIMAIEFILPNLKNLLSSTPALTSSKDWSTLAEPLGLKFGIENFLPISVDTVDVVYELVQSIAIKQGKTPDEILPIKDSGATFLQINRNNSYLEFKYRKYPKLYDLYYLTETQLKSIYYVLIENRTVDLGFYPMAGSVETYPFYAVMNQLENSKRFYLSDKPLKEYNPKYKGTILQSVKPIDLLEFICKNINRLRAAGFEWMNDTGEFISESYISFLRFLYNDYAIFLGIPNLPSRESIKSEIDYYSTPSETIINLYLFATNEVIKKISTDMNEYYTQKKITSAFYRQISDRVDGVLEARKGSDSNLIYTHTASLALYLLKIGYQLRMDPFSSISSDEAKVYHESITKPILEKLKVISLSKEYFNKTNGLLEISSNFCDLYFSHSFYKTAATNFLRRLLGDKEPATLSPTQCIIGFKKSIQRDKFLYLYQVEFDQWKSETLIKVKSNNDSYGKTIKEVFSADSNPDSLVETFIKYKSVDEGKILSPVLGTEYDSKFSAWVNSSDEASLVAFEELDSIERQLIEIGEPVVRERYLDSEAIPCLLKNSIIGG